MSNRKWQAGRDYLPDLIAVITCAQPCQDLVSLCAQLNSLIIQQVICMYLLYKRARLLQLQCSDRNPNRSEVGCFRYLHMAKESKSCFQNCENYEKDRWPQDLICERPTRPLRRDPNFSRPLNLEWSLNFKKHVRFCKIHFANFD